MEIKPFKIRVTPEQSRIVQQTLFSNNYTWFSGDTDIKHISSPHLYFYEDTLRQTEDFQESFFIEHELPEITFQEFFDRYVKWCVKCNTQEEATVAEKYIFKKCIDNFYLPKYISPFGITGDRGGHDNHNFWKYIELTFEQFEKYVLKTKDMEKKIIGYKLKEDCKQYEEAVLSISTISRESFYSWIPKVGYNFGNDSVLYSRFEKAGVLGLWFEPVYEESSKELYFGKVKFTIKKGDNFATTEYGKVTKEEIGNVISWIENPPALVCGKYPLKFDLHNDSEIKFGCQLGRFGELRIIYEAFE